MFDYFVELALQGLICNIWYTNERKDLNPYPISHQWDKIIHKNNTFLLYENELKNIILI